MKSIMIIFGTRPEAIKMAPVILALKKEKKIQTIVCISSQHKEMLEQVLSVFKIAVDINLSIMEAGQDLTDITSNVILGLRKVFKQKKPDIVLVHGDTSTTMAASVASFYAGIPIGHVEAGLRSYNMHAPWPEEFNRRVVSIITDLHFAPTNRSRDQLQAENIHASKIKVTGNTVIDSLQLTFRSIQNNTKLYSSIEENLFSQLNFDFSKKKYILITGHRRENFSGGFEEICRAIKYLARTYPHVHFVYPVHLNPNVQKPVYKYLSNIQNIHLINPLEYEPFIWLLKHCYIVLTDSGGIQEEAPSFAKPVLVMRDVTERPEAVESGVVQLVGTNFKKITETVSKLIEEKYYYDSMAQAINPYGDGKASERIVNHLKDYLEI